MANLLLDTFKPFLLIGLWLAQVFCILFGALMLFVAIVIHSGLGMAESLVFLIPAILLTALRRIVTGIHL